MSRTPKAGAAAPRAGHDKAKKHAPSTPKTPAPASTPTSEPPAATGSPGNGNAGGHGNGNGHTATQQHGKQPESTPPDGDHQPNGPPANRPDQDEHHGASQGNGAANHADKAKKHGG